MAGGDERSLSAFLRMDPRTLPRLSDGALRHVESELYTEWYEAYGWQRYCRAAVHVNRHPAATECLWLSPAAIAARQQRPLLLL